MASSAFLPLVKTAAYTLTEAETTRLDALFTAGLPEKDPLPCHWIHGNDEATDYCYDCAQKKLAELLLKTAGNDELSVSIDGGWGTEHDSMPYCETCYKPLQGSLTQYACESEVEHFLAHGFDPNCESDCAAMSEVISSTGWSLTAEPPPHRTAEESNSFRRQQQYFWDLGNLAKLILAKLDYA